MNITDIIVKAKITEKALAQSKKKVYSFVVSPRANKTQIKSAVEKLFKVKVSKVLTATRKGKVKRIGRKGQTKKLSSTKIAYVKVSEGTIDIFPKD